MSENRCQCGGLRHKHDIERVGVLESSLAQAQADMEALQDGLAQYESVRNLLDELQQEAQTRYQDYDPGQVNVLLIRVKQALDALPEHLRGTSN